MEVDKFNLEFSNLQKEIESKLNLLKSDECENRIELFDKTLEQFNEIKEKLDLTGENLPQYLKKVSQEKINQLLQQINGIKNLIQPKKTFKFNLKNNKTKQLNKQANDQIKSNNQIDLNQTDLIEKINFEFFGLKDKNSELLELKSDEVNGKDIQLSNLINCEIKIFGNPSTVHIVNCTNCKINCGPVSTSIFIDQCKDTIFQLFCQQLRVHNTIDSIFYLHVTTKGIIEDCKNLQFACYNFQYDQLEEHILQSKLNRSINNWNEIDDFNWLVKNQQSPNWSILS